MTTETDTEFDVTRAVNAMIWARDEKKRLKAEYTAKAKPINDLYDQLEGQLLRFLKKNNFKHIATDAGTIYLSEDSKASLDDPEAFMAWIKDDPTRLIYLERRASAVALKSYHEEHKKLPPGAKLTFIETVTANRVPGREYVLK